MQYDDYKKPDDKEKPDDKKKPVHPPPCGDVGWPCCMDEKDPCAKTKDGVCCDGICFEGYCPVRSSLPVPFHLLLVLLHACCY
jgi:hypothetical protein